MGKYMDASTGLHRITQNPVFKVAREASQRRSGRSQS